MSVPPSPRIAARGPTPPVSPALQLSHRTLSSSQREAAAANGVVNSSLSHNSQSQSQQNLIQASTSSSNYIAEVEVPFSVRPGDRIANKYEVLCLIGRGTFSSVYGCRVIGQPFPNVNFGIHHTNPYIPHNLEIGKHDQIVAMKVVRDVERYRKAAEREIALLELMKKQAKGSSVSGCIELLDYFLWSNRYVCMIFPIHGSSIYDFLYRNHFLPFYPSQLQNIARQICQTLANLHENNIVHADLKPENILFQDSAYESISVSSLNVHIPTSTGIKFIDFGTAILNNNSHKPKIVASRSYRPLEVIFETGWSTGVDIWSAGCIFYELYTGIRLFNLTHTCTDMDHLRMMESVLGPIPTHLKQKSFLYAHQIITPYDDDVTSATCMAISPQPSTHHGLNTTMNSTVLLQMTTNQHLAPTTNNSNNMNVEGDDNTTTNVNHDKMLVRKMSMSSTSSAPSSPLVTQNRLTATPTSYTSSSSTSSTSLSSSPMSSTSTLSSRSLVQSSPSSPQRNPSLRLGDRIEKQDHLLFDLIQKMLAYDPSERISAKQALQHPYFLS